MSCAFGIEISYDVVLIVVDYVCEINQNDYFNIHELSQNLQRPNPCMHAINTILTAMLVQQGPKP